MAFRSKMTRSGSRKHFRRNAGSHRKNYSPPPMRGGIAL